MSSSDCGVFLVKIKASIHRSVSAHASLGACGSIHVLVARACDQPKYVSVRNDGVRALLLPRAFFTWISSSCHSFSITKVSLRSFKRLLSLLVDVKFSGDLVS